MSNEPQTGAGPAEARMAVPQKPLSENPVLKFAQRPRIMLIMLAVWSLIGFLTELFVNAGLFVEDHRAGDLKLDGAFGGLALGWEALPLTVLYVYCARDPVRYQRIFWLALIHLGGLVAANLYQWIGRETLTFESVVVPLVVSVALGTLVFLHLFQPREAGTAGYPAARSET